MIRIEQKKTTKVPGITSLYITFDYNEIIVQQMKTCSGSHYDAKSKTWEVPISYLSSIIEHLSPVDDITLVSLKETKKKKKDYKLHSSKTKLFDYQKDGVMFGLENERFLLLDKPGLGKTLQVITIANELKINKEINHCLVICGINSLKMNWVKEIHKHSDLSCRILGQKYTKTGKFVIGSVQDRVNDLKTNIEEFFVITNVETLRSNDIVKEIEKGKNKFDLIILDEIHVAKSPSSIQGRNLLKLKSAKRKIGLTGTLLLNDPLDCYVPLKWIDAERSTYTNFKYYYCNFGGYFQNEIIGYKNIPYLKEQLSKVSLRRGEELLNLPPKTIINEYVEMEDAQRSFYENIKQGIIDQVDKVKMSTATVLSLVSRLRQATACPSILTSENISSVKIDRCVDIINQVLSSNDSIVVFSTFKQTLSEIQKKLKKNSYYLCTGDTNDEVISKSIDEFQHSEKGKIFLATWQKCGTGITLTRARYMIFIDTPWTNAVFQQACDRIYRIGTKNEVFIYNLIAKNTIDERVLELVEDKAALSDYIIDDTITQKGLESLKKYIQELCPTVENLENPS